MRGRHIGTGCMHCMVPMAEVWVTVKTPTLSLVASHLAGRKMRGRLEDEFSHLLMKQDTEKGRWLVPGCPDGTTSTSL